MLCCDCVYWFGPICGYLLGLVYLTIGADLLAWCCLLGLLLWLPVFVCCMVGGLLFLRTFVAVLSDSHSFDLIALFVSFY